MSGEIEAGRDLDTRIAKEVMGWTDVRPFLSSEVPTGVPPEGWDGYVPPNERPLIPFFSEEIGAAWSVVEKMRHKFSFRVDDNLGMLPWYASFTDFSPHLREYRAEGRTAPEALCLAALAAVGAQRGEK